MIRNTRLLEVMMKDALKIEIDEEMVCGIEHHMKTKFTDALNWFSTFCFIYPTTTKTFLSGKYKK
jgi:Mn-dependent DtxR family transcriptional regulator